jgi:hypothetical protein
MSGRQQVKKQRNRKKQSRKQEKNSKARTPQEHFFTGLIVRGEAAIPKNGQLPPGATHEIVDEAPQSVFRRRFSAA